MHVVFMLHCSAGSVDAYSKDKEGKVIGDN